jgi:hypothetical protein
MNFRMGVSSVVVEIGSGVAGPEPGKRESLCLRDGSKKSEITL